MFYFYLVLSAESSRVLKARQQTQARFESFLQDAVADNRCSWTPSIIIIYS